MPTYEYQCQACGHRFDEFHSITAKPLKKCPACKKLKLQRLIGTGAGIIFKGSGFYETDYRSDSYKSAAKADAAPAAPAAAATPAPASTTPAAPAAPAKSESAPKTTAKPAAKSTNA